MYLIVLVNGTTYEIKASTGNEAMNILMRRDNIEYVEIEQVIKL